MELQGERLIPATVETTWAALNDPATLKGCIANCESLERTGENQLAAVVVMKIGPVSARFKGNLTITHVQAPNSYTINFDGQGGMAGFGKGSADVALLPTDSGQTTLNYLARATVGGKIAQIGSRLIDSAAAKITNDFFAAFETQLEARGAAMTGGSTPEFGTAAGPDGPGGRGNGAVSRGPGDAAVSRGAGTASALADVGGGAMSNQAGDTPGTAGRPSFRASDSPDGAPAQARATGRRHGLDAAVTAAGPAGVAAVTAGAGVAGVATGTRLVADPAIVRYWALIGAVIALGAVYFAIR